MHPVVTLSKIIKILSNYNLFLHSSWRREQSLTCLWTLQTPVLSPRSWLASSSLTSLISLHSPVVTSSLLQARLAGGFDWAEQTNSRVRPPCWER